MKKLLVAILIICLVFAGAISYRALGGSAALFGTDAEAEPIPAAETEAVAVQTLDMEALYALYPPEKIVMTVDGMDISWGEYYYWLNYYASNVQSSITAYSYYGAAVSWSNPIDAENDTTFAQYVVNGADSTVRQFAAAPGLAEKDGLAIDQEAVAQRVAETREAIVGAEASDDEYQAALAERRLPQELVEHMALMEWAFQADYESRYGVEGEKLSDEDALKYLEDKGYISASHILITTVDTSTMEALEPSVVAEKKALAEKLLAELSAIEDHEALVARFKELKAQYCEDPGKESFPEGYVFATGEMTPSFETAAFALEEYGLSEIVESEYGYHIILRLPNDADMTVEYSAAGLPRSARALAADAAYNDAVVEYMKGITPVYAEGYETPDLLDYVK